MTSEQEQAIQKNLEILKKHFNINDKIQKSKNGMYYELHIIKVNDILDIYIRAVVYQNTDKILYEFRITKGKEDSKKHRLLSINLHNIYDFSIKNIEDGIIAAASRLVKNKTEEYKAIFGNMGKLGVKKWIKLNNLKQKLK